MRIKHVPIHPDLAMPLALGAKTVTRRPMKPQPLFADEERILFGDGGEGMEMSVWRQDYPCPLGSVGDLLIFYFEGNSNGFHEAKMICPATTERLLDITDEEAKKEGFEDRAGFLDFWDKLYGETEFSTHLNPWVWRVRFCKN